MIKKRFLLFALCLLASVATGIFLYKKYTRKVAMQGHVIIFDGASSAGKSSVIRQLMPMLDSSYQYIAVDDFVTQVFVEQQKLKLSEKEFLDRVNQQSDLMYKKIKTLVADGKNVILDTVLSGLEGEKSVREQLEKLKDLPVTMVLVHCPLLVLIERIKQRNEKALRENKLQDERSIGTALSQFGCIYRLRISDDEPSLGTLLRKDVEYTCEVAKKEWSKNVERFEQFKEWLLLQLGVKGKETVTLTTRLKYDFIVDTSKNMPQECAQAIRANLMSEGKMIMKDCLTKKRLKHEPPAAIAERGWRYHHLGIPYTEPRPGETHYAHLKVYVSGFETSPYGIEWMRFEKDCSVPDVVRKVPHVAFEVDDLDEALKGKEILLEPGTPSGGCRAAMIMHDGAPIELIEFKKNKECIILKRLETDIKIQTEKQHKKIICHDIHHNVKEVNSNQLTFRPSVYGVLIENNRVLLSKQWDGYDFPGGGIDIDETIEQALKREFLEETGIEVELIKPLACTTSFFHPSYSKKYQDQYWNCPLMYFLVKQIGGNILNYTLTEEEQDYADKPEWISLNNVCDIKFYNAIDSIKLLKDAVVERKINE